MPFLKQQMNASVIEGGRLRAEEVSDKIFDFSIIREPLLFKGMLHRPEKVEVRQGNVGRISRVRKPPTLIVRGLFSLWQRHAIWHCRLTG